MTALNDQISSRKDMLQELEQSICMELHKLKMRHQQIQQKKVEIAALEELNKAFQSRLSEEQQLYLETHLETGIQIEDTVYMQVGSKICIMQPKKIEVDPC